MIKGIQFLKNKKLMSRSLRKQLLTRTLFILSLILLSIGLLQFWVMKDFLYKNEAETLRAKMMSLPPELDLLPFNLENNEKKHPDPNRPRFLFSKDISLAIIGQAGSYKDFAESTGMSSPKLSSKEYEKILEQFSNRKQVTYKVVSNKEGIEQLIVFKPIRGTPNSSDGYFNQVPEQILQIGTDIAPLRDVLFQQLLTFIVLSVLALLIGLALYLPVLKNTLIPLSNIVNAVKNTNAGNLADRLPTHQGQEEVDQLALAYNDMLKRLEASFQYERETKEKMKRFIADASHELRTPLTSIHGFLEVLLRGAANRPEQLYNALNSMHGESKRIIKLVEDLLFLAKMDREPGLHLSETNLTKLIRQMKPQLSVLGGHRQISYDLTEGVKGTYDADKIKQIILNLFHNAVQHTDSTTGKITVSLMVLENQVEISLKDNGSGIKLENLPYVFDRFYRIDDSRTRQHGGSGLGLAITQTITQAHGGTVSVKSKFGEGTTFYVYLPIISPSLKL
ncbi:HAMP domain-containing sensor histidine kinase [Bacillus toyonensis]|uniref:sensor histidine kinase n=1 Tax=Bacillus toyonensis TaxID=155322 RepID=UPI000CD9F3A8|nr:HAMP domain-containing sensor histidine kinase [Bacillus toyonensis]MED3540735.1 HAMP domain-containing sensor histidine kinase [Bacillus toyonensis]MEE2021642.1 HAMP domain-containing sensor histidine kinase [Bacillus toyonensis]